MRSVTFDVPVEVAFDYLVEPRNRPEWQSTLSRVTVGADVLHQGMQWVDVTRLGLRVHMQLVEMNRPELWSERGEWRDRVRARLTLSFAPAGDGCEVVPDLALWVDGWFRQPLTAVLMRLATRAVRSDLGRAARILSEHQRGH